MKINKNLNLFVPAIALSTLLFTASFFMHKTAQSLLILNLPPIMMPYLKTISIFPALFLAIVYIWASKTMPFEQIFKKSILYIACAILIASVCVFFENRFSLQWINYLFEKLLPVGFRPLASHKAVVLFDITANIANYNLFSVLIWGLINQFTNRSDSYKIYLPLAGILGVLLTILAAAFYPFFKLLKTNLFPYGALIALILMLATYFMFHKIYNFLSSQYEEEAPLLASNKFPILSASCLLGGALLAGSLTHVLFNLTLKTLFSNPSSYLQFSGKFSLLLGIFSLTLTVLWATAGTWVLINKGWQKLLNYGLYSVFIGGGIFFALSRFGTTGLLVGQSMSKAIFTSTSSLLFFALIQIFYLTLPRKERFAKKVVTEMAFLPLIKVSSSFISQTLIIAFGSLAACRPYFITLFILFLGILYLTGRSLKNHFPESKVMQLS